MNKKSDIKGIDTELYKEFREHIKRTKGKIHGNLINSVEDALELYMKINEDPKLKILVSMQLERGNSHTPKNKIKNFYKEFNERFDYPLVGSGELNNWIKLALNITSETALKKWRNRLRDNGYIVYLKDNMWRLPGNETGKQVKFTPLYDKIYNSLQPGKTVRIEKLKSLCEKEGGDHIKIIMKLEKEHLFKRVNPGVWEVLEPEIMET